MTNQTLISDLLKKLHKSENRDEIIILAMAFLLGRDSDGTFNQPTHAIIAEAEDYFYKNLLKLPLTAEGKRNFIVKLINDFVAHSEHEDYMQKTARDAFNFCVNIDKHMIVFFNLLHMNTEIVVARLVKELFEALFVTKACGEEFKADYIDNELVARAFIINDELYSKGMSPQDLPPDILIHMAISQNEELIAKYKAKLKSLSSFWQTQILQMNTIEDLPKHRPLKRIFFPYSPLAIILLIIKKHFDKNRQKEPYHGFL